MQYTLNATAKVPSDDNNNQNVRYGYTDTVDLNEDEYLNKYFDFGAAVALIGDNTNNILNGNGYKYVAGSKGNDYLYGGYGSKFEFNAGDGNDVLYTSNSSDEIVFCNVYDMTYEQSNDDLIIKYNSDSDSILVKDYYNNINPIKISIRANQTKKNEITTSDFSEIIYCGTKGDTINSGASDDTIYAGADNDNLNGGLGNDTYRINDVYQHDVIYDEGGSNDIINLCLLNKDEIVLRFDLQIDTDGNIIEDSSKNMYIVDKYQFTYKNWGTEIIDQFVENHGIEIIKTADGYYLGLTELNQLRTNVANWLSNNNFESVEEVLSCEIQTQIESLYAEFQNANWQNI